jgi:hypothetical protein
MVAPGYITVGCNAGTTHPISGTGIRGAAVTGYSAGKHGAAAVHDDEDDFVSEADLWAHNHFVYVEHGLGTRTAAKDPYNVVASHVGMENVRAAVALLPEDTIANVVSSEGDSFGVRSAVGLATGVVRNALALASDGRLDRLDTTKRAVGRTIRDFVRTRRYAEKYERLYERYPANREGFFEWRDARDSLDEAFNDELGIPADRRKY